MKIKPSRCLFFIAAFLLSLTGCSSPKEYFYTLSATAKPNVQWQTARNIYINPIHIPASVDRPPIVIQKTPQQVTLLEQRLWASPLKDQILSVLALNLTRLSQNPNINTWPQLPAKNTELTISMQVLRFESIPNQGITLEVQWTFLDRDFKSISTQHETIHETASDDSIDALIVAHNQALVTLASKVAHTLPSTEH
ncbi:membrane integrity-associated transporter subunit PqiC [uncultured Deefgea sp.]|uniref:PqiC family protein n=1 Tax=uncultured Deefgea sp. TaxID=1304914 RepID=UPI00261C3364|nr:PqiC family protein [uncultured Deefgea sp.]